ncbi:MAG: glycosyltransferase [Tannerella sp.]|jgi:hypothetical protein|nr:glycosyltransferase [Tannerella sp.]
MTLLYLAFRGFDEFNGISKKMKYQIDALRTNGFNVKVCYQIIDVNNSSKRMIDNDVLEDFGNGFISKFKKRFSFDSLVHYIKQEHIKFLYIRYEHNASPSFISALKKIKKTGTQIVLEIPTYPYDKEYWKQGLKLRFHLWQDQCFRKRLAKQVSRIITFSEHKLIFGVPTVNISNGVDFESVPLKKRNHKQQNRLNLLGVAEIHLWHGFDRLIAGLGEYYKTNRSFEVYFNIIGYGAPDYVNQLKSLVLKNNIEKYVHFHGPQYGDALTAFFDDADMGIASLARHRSNIYNIKTLKNREYAARGIPFVYSEFDTDFEDMPYILKVPANEIPIDIEQLIRFYENIQQTSQEIRESISHLSWESQMQKVINEAFV